MAATAAGRPIRGIAHKGTPAAAQAENEECTTRITGSHFREVLTREALSNDFRRILKAHTALCRGSVSQTAVYFNHVGAVDCRARDCGGHGRGAGRDGSTHGEIRCNTEEQAGDKE